MPDWSGISQGQDKWVREQVAARIEAAVTSGEYGHRLPAQKRIAAEAGVGINTVAAAIRILRDKGLVYTVPNLGTFIRKPTEPPSAATRAPGPPPGPRPA